MERNIYKIGKELFITSDEEIKEGDWVIKKYETKFPKSKANEVLQVNKINTNNGYLSNGNYYNFSNYLTVVVYDRPFQGSNDNNISRKSFNNGFKKIILTTDQDLIKDGVQAIDDEFLEWFCSKNGEIEYVNTTFEVKAFDSQNREVDFAFEKDDYTKNIYKIIIPKEEPYERTIQSISLSEVDKEEPKQETLEEVAERLYPNYQQEIFIKGAKWQQEQQDKFAIEFGDWIGKNTITYNNGKFRMKTLTPVFLTSEQLLEQFKKK